MGRRGGKHLLRGASRGLTLAAIRQHDVATYVATYIEELQAKVQAPSVKQQLAAIRMVFNWLVTG